MTTVSEFRTRLVNTANTVTNEHAKQSNLDAIKEIDRVKYFIVTTGDYNDVFDKTYYYGNDVQMDQHCLNQFSVEPEDLGSDSIGYCIYYDNDEELLIEYYIEAEEINDPKEIEELEQHRLNNKEFYHYGFIVDLTQENNLKNE